ncbi:MAG: glycosyltransferase family 2 protein [Verrucomicrobiota bacterium]|nr:glycosyltransferase family 2 protein [Limisphaera sp.]MDW8380821.1 glycosyltransferase family 2 protein [Verrucomicrobiota bacterium]
MGESEPKPASCEGVLKADAAGLTVIIVNWNGGEKLLRCLGSIRASQTSFPVKVIVVDNDSHDGSREKAAAEFPEFCIFNTGANLGFGRGNNYARPWVDTPLVLFLNPDTELFPDTLEKAVRSLLSRPHVAMLGCQMRDPDGTVQEQGLQWFPTPGRVFLELLMFKVLQRGPWARQLRLDPHRSGPVYKLYGGFLLVRKSVLDAAGWFDERYFMYAEDVDLCQTVRDLGWELYYEAGCAILHDCGSASRKAPSGFSILMKQRSVNLLIAKYYGPFAAMRHRWAVAIAAGMRVVGFELARRLVAANPERRRALREKAERSQLLWQWAWKQREAAIPKHPETAVSVPRPGGGEASPNA